MSVSRWLQGRVWGYGLLVWWFGQTWRLRHPVEAYHGWRFQRWLHTEDGQAYYLAMNFLIEHGQYTTVHELSPSAYANWDAPLPKP